eukprot:jgi/Botrbrau1/5311/Bobra.0391s0023.1
MAYFDTGKDVWLEEELESGLKLSVKVLEVLHSGQSEFQTVELVESEPFGKLLLLDGKAQSAEADEFVYHELLVHPALLSHPNPRNIFICGGGEGATAREVLRHRSVEKVVMCDIDQVVCDFCKRHLPANTAAFADPRLELVYNDARAQLEAAEPESFDVIIADLADPLEDGPCYQLYTQEFYENVVKRALRPGGIFVTQAGPAGVLACTDVFTVIHNTAKSVFQRVVPYTAPVPSYADAWGWVMGFTSTKTTVPSPEKADALLAERLASDLQYLDGATLRAVCTINKRVQHLLNEEHHINSVEKAVFIHGKGMRSLV